MVDRADAGPDGVLDPVRALGVGHDEDPRRGRLLDDRLELDRTEVGVARIVARREDAAARRDLDDVGPHPDELTDLAAGLVRPVDEPGWPARVADHERDLRPGRIPVVAVAAGLGQHDERDLQPRAQEQPVVHRLLDPEVGAAGVADARDPRPERRLEVPAGLVELARERLLDGRPQVDIADRDVNVAIEQSRQDRPALDVDRLVAVQTRADAHDPAVLDRDVAIGRVRRPYRRTAGRP